MLTHFSTFPFAWLAPKSRWYCFNQDTEWMFVPSGLGRQLLRWFILTASRRANVITTNSFIESQFEREGIHSVAQVSIWADQFWASTENNDTRSIDVVILLRKGGMKRLDLYLDLLTRLEAAQTISCAVVTPDPDIYATVKSRAIQLILRPSNQELRALYRRSKIFVSLSDTEGFGLTPLEAMGQGCVPVCRNSGGVQCYMAGPMQRNLIPRSEPLETVLTRISELLANPKELAANSITAAEIFRDGLKESNARREAAIRSLAKVLKHEPA
jgi:glycosyltransferase involved in cell wall biosynthesis